MSSSGNPELSSTVTDSSGKEKLLFLTWSLQKHLIKSAPQQEQEQICFPQDSHAMEKDKMEKKSNCLDKCWVLGDWRRVDNNTLGRGEAKGGKKQREKTSLQECWTKLGQIWNISIRFYPFASYFFHQSSFGSLKQALKMGIYPNLHQRAREMLLNPSPAPTCPSWPTCTWWICRFPWKRREGTISTSLAL